MIDQKTKDELKQKLENIKVQLERELKDFRKPTDMGDDIDALDEEADEAEEFSANSGMAQAVQDRHEAVINALGKLDQGTYGICETCQREIELELLKVDPESRLCKACKASQKS
ncbi:MAG: TraR/DksA C4-type zinc finger protein [bacterium]|nr:TraR/DksA C4-type zinc finger protein [bacterium]